MVQGPRSPCVFRFTTFLHFISPNRKALKQIWITWLLHLFHWLGQITWQYLTTKRAEGLQSQAGRTLSRVSSTLQKGDLATSTHIIRHLVVVLNILGALLYSTVIPYQHPQNHMDYHRHVFLERNDQGVITVRNTVAVNSQGMVHSTASILLWVNKLFLIRQKSNYAKSQTTMERKTLLQWFSCHREGHLQINPGFCCSVLV